VDLHNQQGIGSWSDQAGNYCKQGWAPIAWAKITQS
jgi:hypothetical protein